MSANFDKIAASKSAFRKKLAQKPIEEKLTLLDRLAERSRMIKKSKQANLSPAPH